MATAPAATVVPIKSDSAVVFPEIKPALKIAVWKSADGVFHETYESIKEAMLAEAIKDFAAMNNAKNVQQLTTLLAANLANLTRRVEAAIKSLS